MNPDLSTQDKPSNTDINFSGKTSFIIGFSVLILAFSPYKGSAQSITVQIFNWDISIYFLAGIFLLILFCSTYLYGLNYIRYDFSSILKIEWLRYIEPLAHFFYMTAFMLPFLVLFLLLISYITKLIPDSLHVEAVFNIISMTLFLIAFYFNLYLYKNKKKDLISELSEHQIKLSEEIDAETESDKFSILNLHESIMTRLEVLLIPHIGINIRRIPSNKIISLAWSKQIISLQDLNLITDLRIIRNKIAHNQFSETKEIDSNLMLRGKEILNKLKNKKRFIKK